MFACLDVDYRPGDTAVAACVLFPDFETEAVHASHVERIEGVAPYAPGEFYRRELPCLTRVLARVADPLEIVVVDGYVALDASGTPGLGERLREALGAKVAVIGVAKTRFATATQAVEVLRGESKAPLFVTAAGMAVDDAAARIRSMHGPHRIPTLLRAVDRLCRDA